MRAVAGSIPFRRYALFMLSAASINIIDGIVARSSFDSERRLIVAVAGAFDVVAVVLALYYWLLVRPGIRARSSMTVVALLGAMRATYFFPAARVTKGMAAGLCEAALLAWVVSRIRQRNDYGPETNGDPLAAIHDSVRQVLPLPGVANAIRAELGILYYALFSWRAHPHIPKGTEAFTMFEKARQADLLVLLPIACALEILPVHLLLANWSATLAWASTALSVYGLVWLIGAARAFRLRPTLVAQSFIQLRYGLSFELQVPGAAIARVRRAEMEDGPFAVPRRGMPSVCIEFSHELVAQGLFGTRRRLTRIALTPDDQRAFERALADLRARTRSNHQTDALT